MPEKIHYGNNIFFLTSFIRTLNDAVRLKVDHEYFAEKILEDALFIDSTIQKLYISLKENPYLINKEMHLHSIMILKKNYGKLLENMLGTSGGFSAPFDGMRPKIRRILANHLNDATEIETMLKEVKKIKQDEEVFSKSEMEFLMQPFTDD